MLLLFGFLMIHCESEHVEIFSATLQYKYLSNYIVLFPTAWRVLRLRIDERPPIRRVAANKLNKQSRTPDEGWSSSLGVVRGANNPSL